MNMEISKPPHFVLNESAEDFAEIGRFIAHQGRRVAVYGQKPNKTYTYAVYFWDVSEYEFIGDGYWCCCEAGGLYGDLDSAKSDAKRAIELASG